MFDFGILLITEDDIEDKFLNLNFFGLAKLNLSLLLLLLVVTILLLSMNGSFLKCFGSKRLLGVCGLNLASCIFENSLVLFHLVRLLNVFVSLKFAVDLLFISKSLNFI